MAVEFEKLQFTRNWNNASDFPTYEESEQKVRADMQALHDEVKDFINEKLIPDIQNMAVPGTGDMLAEIYDPTGKRTDIYQLASKIGDVKITARTDLGDDWLLCNGVHVSREVYEALGEEIPLNLLDEWASNVLWDGGTSRISRIKYIGGYWVVAGNDVSSSNARIAYAADLAGPWTIHDIADEANVTYDIKDLIYEGGYWAVCGQRRTGTSSSYKYYAWIAYATELDGSWTSKTLWSSGKSSDSLTGLAYADGYWAVGGCHYGTNYCAQIAYTEDLGGSWTTRVLWEGTNAYNEILCIAYGNGNWVVGGQHYDGSKYYARLAYAVHPAGLWTTKDVFSGNFSYYHVDSIKYENNCWVAFAQVYGLVQCAYTNDPAEEWSVVTVAQATSYASTGRDVVFADGLWMACGQFDAQTAQIAFAPDLAGPWTIHSLPGGGDAYGIAFAEKIWAVGTKSGAAVHYYDTRNILLPTITLDGVYAYIKAKED